MYLIDSKRLVCYFGENSAKRTKIYTLG